MRYLLFFAVWLLVTGGAYFYVGRRLIKPSRLQPRHKRLAWVLILVWFLVPISAFILTLLGKETNLTDPLSWAGYGSLALFSILLTLVLARDLLLVGGTAVQKLARLTRLFPRNKKNPSGSTHSRQDSIMRDDQGFSTSRRQILTQTTNLGILGVTAPLMGYGVFEARRRAEVEEVTIPLKGLPPEFDGFRIAQFSDLHAGPTIKRPYVERLVEQLQGLSADCIVFTGDLVDGSVPKLREEVAPLRELTADHDVYFVTGNHEYYSGAQAWVEEADRMGFQVLINKHRVLQRGTARMVVAGVTDYSAAGFVPSHASNPKAALEGSPPDAVKILLAHQPKSIFDAEAVGTHLQLSGHTHGGQFFPWDNLARLAQPYLKGLHRHGNSWIYVSRGVGYWGPPIRIGIPPEITVVNLKASLD